MKFTKEQKKYLKRNLSWSNDARVIDWIDNLEVINPKLKE